MKMEVDLVGGLLNKLAPQPRTIMRDISLQSSQNERQIQNLLRVIICNNYYCPDFQLAYNIARSCGLKSTVVYGQDNCLQITILLAIPKLVSPIAKIFKAARLPV